MHTVRRRPVIGQAGQMPRRHRPDYWLVLLSVILMAIGLIVIYSISPGLGIQKGVSENYFATKQVIMILLGITSFVVVASVPLQWWRRLEIPLLIAAAFAAVLVRFFGERVNGAYRWIQVGGLSFQAAELIKFALLLWLAGLLADRWRKGQLTDWHATFKPLLIALAVIAIVVGRIQSDLGSTAVMVGMMGMMAFMAGMPLKKIATIALVVGALAGILIASSSYRRDRLATYLNPGRDCNASGYQACQALITIGSGGMFGLGLGRSVQAYGYLPEPANDSIFAIYAEKFGFVGSVVLVALFVALFARIKRLIERAPDMYTRLVVSGVLAWLSVQSFINIGAMVGLLPLKGITLPFVSYGGTSIIFVSAALGIVFHISRFTSFAPTQLMTQERRPEDGHNRTDRRRIRGAYHPNSGSR